LTLVLPYRTHHLLRGLALAHVLAGCGTAADSPRDAASAFDAPGSDVASEATDDTPPPAPPFTIVALDRSRIGSANSTGWPNVGKARADVDWGPGPFADVRLVVALDTACFPFSQWSVSPPPPGQNWPADCDAFDRNLNVFIDDRATPRSSDTAPFEVIHAITPFGGPEHLEVDVTDLANARPGRHALVVEIPSFSDPEGLVTGSNGGWTVSARVEITPGPARRRVLAVVPAFVGTLGAGEAFPSATFDVPAGTTGSRLEYRASGHGQGPAGARCIGPAEEFCDRRHQIFVDGAMVDNIEPYRDDCASLCTIAHQGPADGGLDYCMQNPCGDPNSVRSPRANWCPGSMTPPFRWDDLPALATPGPHTLSFQILDIVAGGNWSLSAIYTAYGP